MLKNNGFLNISVGLTILGILSGSIIWVYSTIDKKIEPVEAKAQQAIIETAKLGEAVNTIKKQNDVIQSDIKILLQRIK